jgi:hypothetical protein
VSGRFGSGKQKRTLTLDDQGLKLSHFKYNPVQWEKVRHWLLAPAPAESGLVALTVELGLRGRSGRGYWSIFLDAREQRHAVLSELEYLRQSGRTQAPVIELSQPMPERKVIRKGGWAMGLGFYLLVHGVSLLGIGLSPWHSGPGRNPEGTNRVESGMRPVIRRLHISNQEQLRMVFWVPGAILTSAGLGLGISGARRLKRATTENNRRYDLELEKLRSK